MSKSPRAAPGWTVEVDADDVVLIALVNRPRDLEIVRTEHWYRVPAKHAPDHLAAAQYLAFYLTRAFGEEKWSIREYARVRGHELVRRRDLFPDESDHPRSEGVYYKLELGPLIPLARPIVSRTSRRLLFVWTTGDRFSRAVEINDLIGKSEEDDALWDALKGAGLWGERQVTVRDARARYRVDYWLPCARGNVAIVLGERARQLPKGRTWRALQFSPEQVTLSPASCIGQIRRMVRELGGMKYQADNTGRTLLQRGVSP